MKFKRADLPGWPTDPLDDQPSTELCPTVRLTLHAKPDRDLTSDRLLARLRGEPIDVVFHRDLDPDREHDTDSSACWCSPTIETIDPTNGTA